MNLVKFDCGCVGFAPASDHAAETAIILYACDDRDGVPYGADTRNMRGKSFEPLPAEVCMKHWKNINRLISNGYSYRDVVHLLAPVAARLHDDR